MNQLPPSPWLYHKGRFEFFSKIRGDICSSRFAIGVNNTGGKWKKSWMRNFFMISFGHLWEVELACRNKIFFKFILSWSSLIIVPTVCHRCHLHRWQICCWCRWNRWQFAAGIVDTGGKFATRINNASENGGKICHHCHWYRWCTLTCEYLRKFSKKFKAVLMEYYGAGGKLIHGKKQKQKISWHCPFKNTYVLN